MKSREHIPDDLVERAARAMHAANSICSQFGFKPWNEVYGDERKQWLYLAKCALRSIAIHTDTWPDLVALKEEKSDRLMKAPKLRARSKAQRS